MKNELMVKTVDFMGDSLIVAKDKDGIMWVGVRTMCTGMGLSRGQLNGEVAKIQEDEVLSRGCMKFRAGVFDPNNETIALQLDYIPLWLAKISITPNMKENNPELVEKLIAYQLKAKDVLAAAFLPQRKPTRRKEIGKNEVAKFYTFTYGIVVVIGDEVYFTEPDPKENIECFISRLKEVGESNIPNVLRAYLSVNNEKMNHFKNISGNVESKPE